MAFLWRGEKEDFPFSPEFVIYSSTATHNAHVQRKPLNLEGIVIRSLPSFPSAPPDTAIPPLSLTSA